MKEDFVGKHLRTVHELPAHSFGARVERPRHRRLDKQEPGITDHRSLTAQEQAIVLERLGLVADYLEQLLIERNTSD